MNKLSNKQDVIRPSKNSYSLAAINENKKKDVDLITSKDIIKKIPSLLARLPSVAKGLYFMKLKDQSKTYSIGWALERNAKIFPKNNAILYNDVAINYADLNAWSNRLAHYFLNRDIVKGDVVAVFLENRPEMLAVIAALSKIGAVAALVNTHHVGEALHHSMSLVSPKFYIIGEELTSSFEGVRDRLANTKSDKVFFLADKNTLKEPGVAPEKYTNLGRAIYDFISVNPASTQTITIGDPCFYIYTSGTTGLPKAAISTHGKWIKSYGAFGLFSANLKPSDCLYITLPLFHATALTVCWGSAMAAGCPVALRKRFSVSNFWRDVKKYNVTAFGYIGELCSYLMSNPSSPDEKNNSVTTMIGNGLRPAIWKDFKKRFGIKKVVELYGSSEGNIAFVNTFNFDNTVGFGPAPYAVVKCDPETAKPYRDNYGRMMRCGIGEPGLMIGHITPQWPFVGYTEDAKSQSVILKDVFEKGDKWFNTGDLMRDIGCKHVQFVDRLGDTYRWKGENVSTTEIENLVNQQEQVDESVVFGVEVPHTSGRAGMISMVAVKDTGVDFTSLYQGFEACMPPYAIPLFIRLQSTLEKTGTFKYIKTNLKKEGFNTEKVSDPLYVLLSSEKTYTKLTADIYKDIQENQYRF